jgi:hypothetical protein
MRKPDIKNSLNSNYKLEDMKIKTNKKEPLKHSRTLIVSQNIKEDPSTKLTNELLIDDHHKSKFLNFDIKLNDAVLEAEKTKKHSLKTSTQKNHEINKTQQVDSLKEIKKHANEIKEKMNKIKAEFDDTAVQITCTDLNYPFSYKDFLVLKSELLYIKAEKGFLELKTEIYQNMFYSAKNRVENALDLLNMKENQAVVIISDLKNKLNEILNYNNQNFYKYFAKTETSENFTGLFSSELISENKKNVKSIEKLENILMKLMLDMKQVLTTNINENYQNLLWNLHKNLGASLKQILSFYIFSDNYNIEFKNKNSFFLENEEELSNLEKKDRTSKILKEIQENLIDPNMNRAMNKKFKKDMVEKVKDVINFYENYNIILKTENILIKNNSASVITHNNFRLCNIQKLIESYFIYSEIGLTKIKELNELINSKSLKNQDKVILAFLKTENFNLLDLIEKNEYLKRNYYLI